MQGTVVLVCAFGALGALGALAACGDVVTLAPDGGDAPAIDAPTEGELAIRVYTLDGDGIPAITAEVVVQDLAGAELHRGMVPSDGRIALTVPVEGVNVHVIRRFPEKGRLTAVISTVMAAAPGDDLVFGALPGTLSFRGNATQMIASVTQVSGATNQQLVTDCDAQLAGTFAQVPLTFRDGCHGATFPLLAVTAGLSPNRYTFLPDVTYTPGATFNVPLPSRELEPVTVEVSHVPPAGRSVQASYATVLEKDAHGRETATATQLTGTLQFPFDRYVPGTRSEVEVRVAYNDSPTVTETYVRGTPSQGTVAVDAEAMPLPRIAPDTARTTSAGFTWETLDATAEGDALVAFWYGSWSAGDGRVNVEWRIVSPWQATGLALPVLPPELAEVSPQAAEGPIDLQGGGFVASLDVEPLDGYPAFRARADQLMFGPNGAIELFGLTTPFTMKVAQTDAPSNMPVRPGAPARAHAAFGPLSARGERATAARPSPSPAGTTRAPHSPPR